MSRGQLDPEEFETRAAERRGGQRARGPNGTRRWLWVGLIVGPVVAAVVVVAVARPGPQAQSERPPERGPERVPNLLVVMVDDQTIGSFTDEVMPTTLDFFDGGGSTFDQAIAAPPLCCPARAGFLTGRYAQNHGVVENDIGYATMRGKKETFPVALQAAGYRTAMIGKFLNGYERVAGTEPAPGFQRWNALVGYADYFNYEITGDDGTREVARYATRELTAQARDFVSAESERPFFLWLSYNAPHTVLPGYGPPCDGLGAQPPDAASFERFADAKLPRPPSFDEKDTSDRPSLATHPNPLGPRDIQEATRAWRCSLAAMRDVDDQVGCCSTSSGARASSTTPSSYIGYYYGEHRLTDDKRLPLEPALRIPMAIRVGDAINGGDQAPARIEELVSQVDLAPTLLDYAGAAACPPGRKCDPLDGRSLRGLLEGADWPADRAIPLTLDDGWSYKAMRTDEELYMEVAASRKQEFAEPQPELYELRDDPDQLDNLAADANRVIRKRLDALALRLADLTDCAGIEGRDRARGRPFCE